MDIPKVVSGLLDQGATSFSFLSENDRRIMLDEFQVHPLQQAPKEIGRTQQNFLEGTIDPAKAPHTMRKLQELEWYLKEPLAGAFSVPLDTFFINEQRYQQYPPATGGITGHKDETRYGLFIAVLILEGKGEFRTHADREASNSVLIPEAPGYCILIRAHGLSEVPIPFHSVSSVSERRTVIGARYDSLKSGL